MYYQTAIYNNVEGKLIQETYKLTVRVSRFPSSGEVARAVRITDKPEPCVAAKVSPCTIFCTVCK